MPALSDFLEFAIGAAWQAGRSTLAHYQTEVAVERKPDQSVVTIADRTAEQIIPRLIATRFPDHAIVGEEFGGDSTRSAHRWMIDPIDGTTTFVRGVPFYGVLIALEIEGVPEVGVSYFPALDEMVSAATGLGCRWNGRPGRVSAVRSLDEATVVYTDAGNVQARLGPRWNGLLTDTAVQRGWGDCYGHALVATGRADIM